MPPLTFDTVFAPHGATRFLKEVIGQSALYFAGEPEKFSRLVSWDELNHLLEFGGLSYPRLRLLKGGEELPEQLYCRAGRSGYPRPLVRELTSQLRDGAVLAVQSIDELNEPIAALCQMFEGGLRVPVQADLFANCHDEPVAPLRWNDQDVIVIQVEGRRGWELYSPTTSAAIDTTKPTGNPAWHGVLNVEDLLYLPRGWWCRDDPVGEHAMCLGLRFRNPMGLDVVTRIVQRVAALPIMNRCIPRFGGLEAHGGFLTSLQREMTDAFTEPGLILNFLAESRHLAEPRRRFCLPWTAQKEPPVPSDDCVVLPLLRFPEAGSVVHSETEDTCQVALDGQPVTFPEEVGKLIELIFDRGNATVGFLRDACAKEIPPDRISACLAELTQSAVICLQEPVREGRVATAASVDSR